MGLSAGQRLKTTLMAIATQNAVVALVASSNRTTSREEDRVYGIEQIFGFRLGITDVSAASGRQFTLDELEVQLGREMLAVIPIHSQAHIFPFRPVAYGQDWRANSNSVVPFEVPFSGNLANPHNSVVDRDLLAKDADYLFEEFIESMPPRFALLAAELHRTKWGFFHPKVCSFQCVADQARRFASLSRVAHLYGEMKPDILVTHLDASYFSRAALRLSLIASMIPREVLGVRGR